MGGAPAQSATPASSGFDAFGGDAFGSNSASAPAGKKPFVPMMGQMNNGMGGQMNNGMGGQQ